MAISVPLSAAQPDQAAPEAAGTLSVQARPVVPPAVARGVARALRVPTVGAKAVPTPPAGSFGVVSSGDGGGGIFRDTDSVAEAWLGSDGYGIQGFGETAGGYFSSDSGAGFAYLGIADAGIEAGGVLTGGFFFDADSTGAAYVGNGDTGIEATGAAIGGSFSDSDSSGLAYVGYGDTGIQARGAASGGDFADSDGTGHAYVGYGDTGVYGEGSDAGAAFINSLTTAYASLALADIDFGEVGVRAGGGDAAGFFESTLATGQAFLGVVDTGVEGYGDQAGAYFELTDSAAPPGTPPAASSYLAYESYGIEAYGDEAGGYFEDSNSSAYAFVGNDTAKIEGSGSVNFVQNHPYDSGLVIVYTAPEGDEAATYTRGSARLQGGEARVALGETFAWVTDPALGLTAYLTPVGSWCDLYVAGKTTDELTVRSRDGSDCTFDYIVWGLRIGFEETTVVREKKRQAYIPSMKSHRNRVAQQPALGQYTALSRWTSQRTTLGESADLDLSSAHALRDLIGEYDPAVHGKVGRSGSPKADRSPSVARQARGRGDSVPRAAAPRKMAPQEVSSAPAVDVGSLPAEDVYARSFHPSASDLASLQVVAEQVEAGDVLAVDPEQPGRLRRALTAADPTVVGVVAAEPGVVLGSASVSEGSRAPVMFSGIALCKVDATYGPILPGDLLVSSPTPGHAMRGDVASPGTVLGKALEELDEGRGTIRVLVMAR